MAGVVAAKMKAKEKAKLEAEEAKLATEQGLDLQVTVQIQNQLMN